MIDIDQSQLSIEQIRAAGLLDRIARSSLNCLPDEFELADLQSLEDISSDVLELVNMLRERAHDDSQLALLFVGVGAAFQNSSFA